MDQTRWEPLQPPQRQPPPLPTEIAFSSDRRRFVRLVTRGAALELVTVGFYRFWLITDVRRHLWSNTLIDGDGAEYTGRGKELLIGFLVALAILAPVYLAYFLISVEAERFKAFASVPLFLAFYMFGQFAIYRARRYRLTRTVWRGVRFWMDGSGWNYAMRALLWGALMALTLGLILPWREAALERYKMQHSHYGDLQGSFEGSGWAFFKSGWWIWLLAIVALVQVALGILVTGFPVAQQFPALLPFLPAVRVLASAAVFIPIAAPFLYAAFKAKEWRWWISGIRFGGVRLESTMTWEALVGLYWKVIGWSFLLSTALGVYVFLATRLVMIITGTSLVQTVGPGGISRNPLLVVLTGIGYLAYVLAFNVVMRVYLTRDLWARVSASVIAHNLDAAADVAARGDLASALGEGFADGLDVAGF